MTKHRFMTPPTKSSMLDLTGDQAEEQTHDRTYFSPVKSFYIPSYIIHAQVPPKKMIKKLNQEKDMQIRKRLLREKLYQLQQRNPENKHKLWHPYAVRGKLVENHYQIRGVLREHNQHYYHRPLMTSKEYKEE